MGECQMQMYRCRVSSTVSSLLLESLRSTLLGKLETKPTSQWNSFDFCLYLIFKCKKSTESSFQCSTAQHNQKITLQVSDSLLSIVLMLPQVIQTPAAVCPRPSPLLIAAFTFSWTQQILKWRTIRSTKDIIKSTIFFFCPWAGLHQTTWQILTNLNHS